jgi:hypothetical protein
VEHDARITAARILQSCPQRDIAWALNRTFALDAVREPQRFPVFADPLTRADAACLLACSGSRSRWARLRQHWSGRVRGATALGGPAAA